MPVARREPSAPKMAPRIPIAAGISANSPGTASRRPSAEARTTPAISVALSPSASADEPVRMLRASWAQYARTVTTGSPMARPISFSTRGTRGTCGRRGGTGGSSASGSAAWCRSPGYRRSVVERPLAAVCHLVASLPGMDSYTAPLRDVRFVLEHITPLADLTATEAFAHADPDLVAGLLEEAGRFASGAIAPTNRGGDAEGSRLVEGDVVTPESFKTAYRQYVEAGWGAIQHPAAFDGGAFPLTVANVIKEFITSANLAFSLGPLLTTGAVYLMQHHCSQAQLDTYVPKLVSGEWAGTMNLTEPQAGSDVGAVTTRAVPAGDGTYRITGQKIYITYGDHDLTDNIIHLVLARLPDAPPGVKGISLFIVPKVLVDDDGSIGEKNNVEVVSTEHKLGIHASPTCVMEYDEAVGYLIGEPNKGMRQMFTMMNDARLGVGIQGLSIAERAYQQAVQY